LLPALTSSRGAPVIMSDYFYAVRLGVAFGVLFVVLMVVTVH
jgi:hypothetical protein